MITTAKPHAPAIHAPPNHAAATPAIASANPDAMRGPRSDQSPRLSRTPSGSTRSSFRSSVPALTLAIRLNRLRERGFIEVRPKLVDKHKLCVGSLPEHEVREAQFTGRADQQIRRWQIGRVEIPA